MSPQLIAFIVLVVVNFMLIVGMVFLERKDPKSCIAWALSFLVLPFISWFIYIMVGKGPKFSKRRWSKRKQLADKKLEQRLKNGDFNFYEGSNNENSQIVKLNYYYGGSPCQSNNEVEFFIDAHEMYDRQLEDIKNATESINVMYYLFKTDAAGKALRDALIEKAKQGVKVNVVYDSSGNLKTNLYFFRDLIKAGGKVHPFFPSIFKLINSNFCYRNHRKIVVIDGKIGYIGGMNIGVDYLSQDKRIKPWRDTHLRIVGESVCMLQTRFIKDFTCSSKRAIIDDDITPFFDTNKYFPDPIKTGFSPIQIISSGPDTTKQEIKYCYQKIISESKKEVYLETPYFIPDDSFLDTILMAQAAGVQVYLVIPKVWDKKIVYHVTISYLEKLLEAGVKVYKYPGFIHSKMCVGDEIAASIGTANLDIRSFALNFEVNAVLYSPKEIIKAKDIIKADISISEEYTLEMFKKRSKWSKFWEAILRLFAPLM